VARLDMAHPANVDGEWFVDTRCIDCDACRQLAPEVFADVGVQSAVAHQPAGAAEVRDAWRAAVACPTQSIGTRTRQRAPAGLYPEEITPGVLRCGYHSEDSFGAFSYLVLRPEGNLLVDSPRWTRRLADPIAALGGIAHVLLTHQDDVADADRWADRFGARVWIHEDDRRAAPYATDLLRGDGDTEIAPGVVAVPVPGHTKGSVVFAVDETCLFTGDSLAWDRHRGDLVAFRGACWYSWTAQMDSLERLWTGHRFAWVLPGHGDPVHSPADELHDRLAGVISRGRRPAR
jgi:glyoxylase-like metal-dependent hydrolase (beta-lactamase superfamily II)/ferredoxin